jgi:hypothetical protein
MMVLAYMSSIFVLEKNLIMNIRMESTVRRNLRQTIGGETLFFVLIAAKKIPTL